MLNLTSKLYSALEKILSLLNLIAALYKFLCYNNYAKGELLKSLDVVLPLAFTGAYKIDSFGSRGVLNHS